VRLKAFVPSQPDVCGPANPVTQLGADRSLAITQSPATLNLDKSNPPRSQRYQIDFTGTRLEATG
jgi:hypothetical protein